MTTDAEIRTYNTRRAQMRALGINVADRYGQDAAPDALTDPGAFLERVNADAADAELAELVAMQRDEPAVDLLAESNGWLRDAERAAAQRRRFDR